MQYYLLVSHTVCAFQSLNTPLHWLPATSSAAAAVRLLLERGAVVNANDNVRCACYSCTPCLYEHTTSHNGRKSFFLRTNTCSFFAGRVHTCGLRDDEKQSRRGNSSHQGWRRHHLQRKKHCVWTTRLCAMDLSFKFNARSGLFQDCMITHFGLCQT